MIFILVMLAASLMSSCENSNEFKENSRGNVTPSAPSTTDDSDEILVSTPLISFYAKSGTFSSIVTLEANDISYSQKKISAIIPQIETPLFKRPQLKSAHSLVAQSPTENFEMQVLNPIETCLILQADSNVQNEHIFVVVDISTQSILQKASLPHIEQRESHLCFSLNHLDVEILFVDFTDITLKEAIESIKELEIVARNASAGDYFNSFIDKAISDNDASQIIAKITELTQQVLDGLKTWGMAETEKIVESITTIATSSIKHVLSSSMSQENKSLAIKAIIKMLIGSLDELGVDKSSLSILANDLYSKLKEAIDPYESEIAGIKDALNTSFKLGLIDAGFTDQEADNLLNLHSQDSLSSSVFVAISTTETSPKISQPFAITITFSEDVNGFEISDIKTGNATLSNFVSTRPQAYTVDVTPTDSPITIDIPANVAQNNAGSANTPATQLLISFDVSIPTVEITTSITSPTNAGPIPITITFSENVTGMTVDDITVVNATLDNFSAVTSSIYTVDINPTGSPIAINLPAEAAQDDGGNGNIEALQLEISYDASAPLVEISSSETSSTNLNPIPITLTFSEDVFGFAVEDILASNANLSDFRSVSSSVYTVDVSPTGASVTIDIPADVAQDSAGNNNLEASQFSISYDGSNPSVAITSPANSPTNVSPIPITITFSEDITGFEVEHITPGNATLSNFNAVSPTVYTIDATPLGSLVTIDVPEGVIQDGVGNNNLAADQFTIGFDITPPDPGNSGALTAMHVGSSDLTVSWELSSDGHTNQDNIEYLAYYSTSSSFDSILEVESGTSIGSFASNLNLQTISGLSPSTQYYVNVIVRDELGNKNVYNKLSAVTAEAEPLLTTPSGASFNSTDTLAYIVDTTLNAVFELNLLTGKKTIVSNGSIGTGSNFSDPESLVLNAAEDTLYVIDDGLNALLAVDIATGNRTIISNGSNGTGTTFSAPLGVVLNNIGDKAYVIDDGHNALFEVVVANGNRTIISNSSNGTGTNFSSPNGLALDNSNGKVYVSDFALNAVFEVDLSTGDRTILSDGSNGTGDPINQPRGISLNASTGKAYVLCETVAFGSLGVNHAVMELDIATQTRTALSHFAGSGIGTDFISAISIDINTAGDKVYVGDFILDALIEVVISSGDRRIISAVKRGTGTEYSLPVSVDLNGAGDKAYVIDNRLDALFEVDVATGNRTIISDSSNGSGTNFSDPTGLAINQAASKAYVTDDSLDALFEVDITTGNRTIISDNSSGSGTVFLTPREVILNNSEDKAYVIDNGIVEVDISNGNRTIISNNSNGSGTNFSSPRDLAINSAGDKVYVTDYSLTALFEVSLTNGNRTVISDGSNGSGDNLFGPLGITVNKDENKAYVTDIGYYGVFEIDLATGNRTINSNSSNGSGIEYQHPKDLVINSNGGAVYVLDDFINALLINYIANGRRYVLSK